MKIFINGYNLKFGGGKNILESVIDDFSAGSESVYALVPRASYLALSSKYPQLQFIRMPRILEAGLFTIINCFIFIPLMVLIGRFDVVINLGNFAILSGKKQITYCHWPYSVYPFSLWPSVMSRKEIISRMMRKALFRICIGYSDHIVVQTQTMKKRLAKVVNNKNIHVVLPSIKLLSQLPSATPKISEDDNGVRLIYPAFYYPHKNHSIIIDAAQLAKENKESWTFLLTLQDCLYTREFMATVRQRGLCDYIQNLGVLDAYQLEKEYEIATFIFMPTLMETFGLPYMEGILRNIPIVTSKRDFAVDLCRNAAEYFDPTSCESIFFSIKTGLGNIASLRSNCKEVGKRYKLLQEKQCSLVDLVRDIT